MGRIEKRLHNAGGILEDIELRTIAHTAQKLSGSCDGSVLTAYPDDDTGFWKEFRRELIGQGCPSPVIRKYKTIFQAYVKELGERVCLIMPNPNQRGYSVIQVLALTLLRRLKHDRLLSTPPPKGRDPI